MYANIPCMYVCILICIIMPKYVNIYDCIQVYMYACIHVCIVYTCVHASMCICMYVYMYACVHTCMYICNFQVKSKSSQEYFIPTRPQYSMHKSETSTQSSKEKATQKGESR